MHYCQYVIGQQAHGAAGCLNVVIQNSPVCPLVACVVIKDIASHECGGQQALSNLICVASWYVCVSVLSMSMSCVCALSLCMHVHVL